MEVVAGKRLVSGVRFDFAQASVFERDLVVSEAAPKRFVEVSGILADASNAPIPYAYVFDRAGGRSAISDARGAFQLDASPVGGIIPLTIRLTGYLPRDTVLSPGSGNAFALQVSLAPTAVGDSLYGDDPRIGYFATLDRNGFYRRRSLATGTFITAEEIDQRNPPRTTELLRDLQDVDVISPNGSSGDQDFPASTETGCALTLLIDGKPAEYRNAQQASSPAKSPTVVTATSSYPESTVNTSRDTFAELVPPELVAGLELYPHASAVPEQFKHGATGCGVIAVWTRSQ